MNLVVKKGSKSRCRASSSIPQPLSDTSRNTNRPAGGRSSIRLLPRQASSHSWTPVVMVIAPGCSPMASAAFVMRFMTTCCTWPGSASITAGSVARRRWIATVLGMAVRNRSAFSRTMLDRSMRVTTYFPFPE